MYSRGLIIVYTFAQLFDPSLCIFYVWSTIDWCRICVGMQLHRHILMCKAKKNCAFDTFSIGNLNVVILANNASVCVMLHLIVLQSYACLCVCAFMCTVWQSGVCAMPSSRCIMISLSFSRYIHALWEKWWYASVQLIYMGYWAYSAAHAHMLHRLHCTWNRRYLAIASVN